MRDRVGCLGGSASLTTFACGMVWTNPQEGTKGQVSLEETTHEVQLTPHEAEGRSAGAWRVREPLAAHVKPESKECAFPPRKPHTGNERKRTIDKNKRDYTLE